VIRYRTPPISERTIEILRKILARRVLGRSYYTPEQYEAIQKVIDAWDGEPGGDVHFEGEREAGLQYGVDRPEPASSLNDPAKRAPE
jgi:hypothetical protein